MDSDSVFESDIISVSAETITSQLLSESNLSVSDINDLYKFRNSKYNKESFILESIELEKAYIFKNQLFIRTLLPIDYSKERQMELQCTR